jgi:hypothetical protein
MEKRQILWAIVFGSMLAITGCGDDSSSNGGSAGSGGSAGANGGAGSGGAPGSGGSSGNEFCSSICTSPCVTDLGMAGEVQDCLDACDSGGIFTGCEAETVAFIDCLEANDCGESGSLACGQQAINWAMCFGAI